MLDINLYSKAWMLLIIGIAIFCFLTFDECWESERDKPWFKVTRTLLAVAWLPLTTAWGFHFLSNSAERSQEYLQIARNHESHNNLEKMLEYAIRSHQTRSRPDVISYLAYAYLLHGDKDSLLKARDVLLAHIDKLGDTGNAVLGVIESQRRDHERAFRILSSVKLFSIEDYIYPWAIIAFVRSGFQVLPYQDARLKMRGALVEVNRRLSAADVKVATGTTEAIVSWYPFRWSRLQMILFHVASSWLEHARRTRVIKDIAEALTLAGEGLAAGFGNISKEDIDQHLRVLNYVLTSEHRLFQPNYEGMISILDVHLDSFRRSVKPSYVKEIAKLELLRNCLIEKYNRAESKRSVPITEDLTFNVTKWVKDDTAVTDVVLMKNYAIPDALRPLERELPARKAEFRQAITLHKNQTVNMSEKFLFEIHVKDADGHLVKAAFCPNFFFS